MCQLHACRERLHKCVLTEVAHREHHLSYQDMNGRAAVYMTRGELPPIFKDTERWPTHAPGKGWEPEHLLDIFSQLFGSMPSNVPRDERAFRGTFLSRRCMVACRKVGAGRAASMVTLLLRACHVGITASTMHPGP